MPKRSDLFSIVAACLALAWLTARAAVQSVTIDEANLYFGYVAPDWPSHWYPTSGNHVLHSALVRLLTYFLGLSHLTFRAPTLLGAALYMVGCYKLCRLIVGDEWMRQGLFLCLIYNPFVMDYLVASRGYALALGFLMLGISIFATQLMREQWSLESCCWASVCLALSLCANFSFAYIDVIVLVLFSAVAVWKSRRQGRHSAVKVAAACLFPGLLAVFLVCGSVLAEFPRSQLYFGATSLAESSSSVTNSLFYEVNPYIANPLVESVLSKLRRFIPAVFLALLLFQPLMAIYYRPWRERPDTVRLALLETVILSSLALSFLIHWLAFRVLKIPLPMERTALFFVPLSLAALAIGAILVTMVRFGAVIRTATMSLLWICVIFFLTCLRLDYFKEWKFGADVKSAYWVLDYLYREQGAPPMASNWQFSQSLNFYRVLNGNLKMPAFKDFDTDTYPKEACAYILRDPQDRDFIAAQHLQLYYRGAHGYLVIVVRPGGACLH